MQMRLLLAMVTTGRWKINVNGTEDSLTIEAAPNQQGVFSGRFLNTECIGFWDEGSQTITFTRGPGGGGAGSTVALFKGYLFRSPPNPPPGQDVLATLAGVVQVTEGAAFDPAISTARRNVFGWFAQIPEVV